MSIVSVENLAKTYTVYDNETRALDGISFEGHAFYSCAESVL